MVWFEWQVATRFLREGKTQTLLIAIGGITLDNAMPLINAGANYVAVISDIFARPVEEIRQRTQSFNQLFM